MSIDEKVLVEFINANKGSGKTFAEFVAELYQGKLLEIYVGDSYEEVSTEQVSTSYPAVFCGKVLGAYKECLIISAAFVDKLTKKHRMGNILFINERAIRAFDEIDGTGIIQDSMLRSSESTAVIGMKSE